MSKLLGLILLVAGCVMLYLGWQSHLASEDAAEAASQSVWLLTIGAIATVWGLAVAMRRRI
jgi:hypothetical protein